MEILSILHLASRGVERAPVTLFLGRRFKGIIGECSRVWKF